MSNLWVNFKKLLPKKKYLIGKVLSTDDTKSTREILPLSGASMIVSGTIGAVDDYVLVEDGFVKQVLPALPVNTAIIY